MSKYDSSGRPVIASDWSAVANIPQPVTDLGAITLVAGDLLYANAGPNLARLAAGTNGKVLTMVAGVPAWATVGASIIDLTADYAWTGNHTWTLAGGQPMKLRSGASGSDVDMAIGRTSDEGKFAVSGGAGHFATGSVAGDIIIRTEGSNNLFLGVNADAQLKFSTTGLSYTLAGTAPYTVKTASVTIEMGAYDAFGGFGRIGTNTNHQLVLYTNGTTVLGLQTNGQIQASVDGSAGTPAYSFFNDPDCGMYRVSANTYGFSSNGVQIFQVGVGALGMSAPLGLKSYIVSGLPGTPQVGWLVIVTDCTTPVSGNTVVGSGGVTRVCVYNGANWIVVG